MKVIYLSGPMTGIAEYNFPAFHAEAKRLRDLGYTVECPAEYPNLDKTWDECLRYDLIRLCASCDTIAMLPGWSASRGAKLEKFVAEALQMQVVTDSQSITEGP